MTRSLRRPIRGLLVGATVVPLGYWLVMMAEAAAHGERFGLVRALRELVIIIAFGGPMALAMVFLWGAPVVYALRLLHVLRWATVVVAGAVGGAMVSLLFAKVQGGDLLRVRMPLPLAVVLGALAGGACWLAGGGRGPDARSGGTSDATPVAHCADAEARARARRPSTRTAPD